jgi:hypothetical protein
VAKNRLCMFSFPRQLACKTECVCRSDRMSRHTSRLLWMRWFCQRPFEMANHNPTEQKISRLAKWYCRLHFDMVHMYQHTWRSLLQQICSRFLFLCNICHS